MVTKKKPEPEPKKRIAEETDLREITRDAKRCLTVVRIYPNWDRANAFDWLTLGQARLRKASDNRDDGRWRLEAYLPVGVTDFEHDSAYALRLPVIGVTFGGVEYQHTTVSAWVDPNDDSEDFHVPSPGYNPMKHPDAIICKDKSCRREDPKGHVIVPERHYVPPHNAELFKAVRGKRIEITFGLARGPEDEE